MSSISTSDPAVIAPPESSPKTRLLSLDAYRGLIMCTLASNGLALAATANRLGYGPEVDANSWGAWAWQTLGFHNSHPPWNSQFYVVGVSYWDLIQPAFTFMVGVSMPYSYAKRRSRGDSGFQRGGHAILRAVVLVLLGVFLQTRTHGLETNALLTNVLSQIGLGYFFVYLLMGVSARWQIVIGATVLASYAGWMIATPLPRELSDAAAESIANLSVPDAIARQFALAHNAAAQTDVQFLRWLLGSDTLTEHRGGYATLNFVPSAVTILLGVIAAGVLRSQRAENEKLLRLAIFGAGCMIVAVLCSFTICPVIKRIWTPAWTLFSGAYVLWALAFLYWLIDVRGVQRWTFPLVVVGTNSLAIYMMSMLSRRWISERLQVYFGDELFSGVTGPTLQAAAVFGVLWLVCLYLYRNKLFFRI